MENSKLQRTEWIEIVELDERVDMSIDPLFLAATQENLVAVNIPNCHNTNCCNS